MQFVKEFAGLPVTGLRAFLDGCVQPFEASALYEVAGARRLVDPERRLSRFRAIADVHLFALAREVVEAAARADELNDYTLLSNDVTHIRYEPGGFFKA